MTQLSALSLKDINLLFELVLSSIRIEGIPKFLEGEVSEQLKEKVKARFYSLISEIG